MRDLKALSNGTVATIILIVAITILAEFSTGLKDALAKLAGHHWVAKGILAVVFFSLFYMFTRHREHHDFNAKKDARRIIATTILGILALLLFFVYEFYK